MSDKLQYYLHIQCADYALLINANHVEEVIGTVKDAIVDDSLSWRQQSLTIVDLCQAFLGDAASGLSRREYLVVNVPQQQADNEDHIALAVSAVHHIEAIKAEDFSELPQLNFSTNRFFDKAYIHPQTGQCIYRLRVLDLPELAGSDL